MCYFKAKIINKLKNLIKTTFLALDSVSEWSEHLGLAFAPAPSPPQIAAFLNFTIDALSIGIYNRHDLNTITQRIFILSNILILLSNFRRM